MGYDLPVQEITYMTPRISATDISELGPRASVATSREVFRNVYRDARSLRDVMHNEFLICGNVEVFIPDVGKPVVGRRGDYASKPGFYASCVGRASSKSGRRYFLERSRECGPVPLP